MSPGRPVCGDRWEAPGWKRRALARHFIDTDLNPFPWPFRHPDQQTCPRRQPAPRFPPLAVPTSILECTALHLRPETSYLYLSRKGARPPASFPSPSWQLLITSSAGCSLLPLAEATGNKCTYVHTKHPREARPPYLGRECNHPRPASGVRTLYL